MKRALLGLSLALAVGAMLLPALRRAGGDEPNAPTAGAALYDRYCLACHGASGDGKGPAAPWLTPRPRDFTRGRYKWRTTPSGKPPTSDDLARVINEGAPGTSMPGFAGILDDAQVAELVRVVKAFAPDRFAKAATPITVPEPPTTLDAERGRELWSSLGCAGCHGDEGRGDGPAAKDLKDDAGRAAAPYDLTAQPLRRGGRGVTDVFVTLVTGLDGTAMPALPARTAAQQADGWALAGYVDGLRWKGDATGDRTAVIADGTRTGAGLVIAAQGEPPESLPPAAASLSSAQCGRCHAKQLREWDGSLHGRAFSPGLLGQLVHANDKATSSCQSCHAPLAEQLPSAPGYDEDLRHEGITCAACHVRGWSRHGPPRRDDSALLPIASYPFVEDAAYERADFCLPCHQLGPESAVNGRPLLNTYREWLEGPYMRRGVQCQHCHMPDREHSWKGAHDETTVKQGLDVSAAAARDGDAVVVTVDLENVGAAHYLPTTATPAAFVTVSLSDKDGKPVGDPHTQRIGRDVSFVKGAWKEREDTRIPPGETRSFAPRWEAAAAARRAHVVVTFSPDAYYEGFYRRLLKNDKLPDDARELIETALERTRASKFTVWEKDLRVR